jgi:NitT/TauT family transport system permease protein
MNTSKGKSAVYALWSLLLLVLIIVFVQVGVGSEWIDPLLIAAPSTVAVALKNGFASGLYWEHVQSTIVATLLGFGLAIVIGIVFGGFLATVPWVERVMYPFIVAFQATPKIAIAPLVIIWAGFGQASKILIVAVVSFFPILVNTMQGLRLRERERLELANALGATRWQTFRYIRLPGSTPYVFAGLEVGAIFALLGAVVAEFVGSRDGLGVLLTVQRTQFDVPGVFATLVVLMVIGLLIHLVMTAIERRVTFWAQEKDQSKAG